MEVRAWRELGRHTSPPSLPASRPSNAHDLSERQRDTYCWASPTCQSAGHFCEGQFPFVCSLRRLLRGPSAKTPANWRKSPSPHPRPAPLYSNTSAGCSLRSEAEGTGKSTPCAQVPARTPSVPITPAEEGRPSRARRVERVVVRLQRSSRLPEVVMGGRGPCRTPG